MRRNRTDRSQRRGGAAVEFALILPIFVMLLSGILDYGYYFYVSSSATQAVRNGVRMGVTKRSLVDMENVAQMHAKDALTDFNLKCLEVEGCKFTHLHKTLSYSGEKFNTYRLTLVRPFSPFMGMVPVPGQHTVSYTMRYEF